MAILREEGSGASELPERATVRDAQRTVPRALIADKGTADMAEALGLAEDQQAEVAMLMDTTAVNFHFLQRRGQNTEVRPAGRVIFPLPCKRWCSDLELPFSRN